MRSKTYIQVGRYIGLRTSGTSHGSLASVRRLGRGSQDRSQNQSLNARATGQGRSGIGAKAQNQMIWNQAQLCSLGHHKTEQAQLQSLPPIAGRAKEVGCPWDLLGWYRHHFNPCGCCKAAWTEGHSTSSLHGPGLAWGRPLSVHGG